MSWRRRNARLAAVRPRPAPAADSELATLYQVYDRTTRKWDVIDPAAGEVVKSKGGGPWPKVEIRKEA